MTSVTVRVATPSDQQDLEPLVVSFPAGRPPLASNFQVYSNGKASRSGGAKRDVVVDNNAVHLIGSNYSGIDAASNDLAKHLVAVADRSAGTLTVYPSDGHVYPMRVHLVNEQDAAPSNDLAKATSEEKTAARRRLVADFGSKKKRKAVNTALLNQATVENQVAGEAIIEKLDQSKDRDASLRAQENDGSEEQRERPYIPPYNEAAERPDDVYKINDIISAEEWRDLIPQVIVKASKKPELLEQLRQEPLPDRLPGYVLDAIPNIATLASKENKQAAGKALMYVVILIRFFCCEDRVLKLQEAQMYERLGEALGLQGAELNAVVPQLLKLYCEPETLGNGRTVYKRSHTMKTKLLSYLLVVCLMVEGFTLQHHRIARLSEDLQRVSTKRDKSLVTEAKLRDFLKELGCTVSTKRQKAEINGTTESIFVRTAQLTVPLKFPAAARRRRQNQ